MHQRHGPSSAVGTFPQLPEHFKHERVRPYINKLKRIVQSRFPPPELSLDMFRGPGILSGYLQKHTTLSQYVASKSFIPLDNGRPNSSEFEATSLAHSLDLRLASYPSAFHMLAVDISAEVDLRRLYAIIKVEDFVKQGWNRGEAWIKMNKLLETSPAASSTYQELDDEVDKMYMVLQKENHYRGASSHSTSNFRGRGFFRGGRGPYHNRGHYGGHRGGSGQHHGNNYYNNNSYGQPSHYGGHSNYSGHHTFGGNNSTHKPTSYNSGNPAKRPRADNQITNPGREN